LKSKTGCRRKEGDVDERLLASRSVVGGSRVRGEEIPAGEDISEGAKELRGERAAAGSREVDAARASDG
jgi:hypothetical protein